MPYEDVQGRHRRKDVSAHQDELPSGEDVHMEETELPEAERRTKVQQAPLKEGIGILTSPQDYPPKTPRYIGNSTSDQEPAKSPAIPLSRGSQVAAEKETYQ